MKKGDAVAAVAQPIAKVVDYFFRTDLQHCAGCHSMQVGLNQAKTIHEIADAFYNRFRFKKNRKENAMRYIVTRNSVSNYVVEAANSRDAIEQVKAGKAAELPSASENYNVQQAPEPQGQPIPIR